MFRKITIFLSLLAILFCGCNLKSQEELLIGVWENEEKLLEFTESEFVFINKNATSVLAFQGSYSFAENPRNAIKMNYLNYAEAENAWFSLENTELGNFVDVVLYHIKDDTLLIKVIANDTLYTFKRFDKETLISDVNQ